MRSLHAFLTRPHRTCSPECGQIVGSVILSKMIPAQKDTNRMLTLTSYLTRWPCCVLCACVHSCGQSLTDARKETNKGQQEVIKKYGGGHRRGEEKGAGGHKGSEVKGEMCRKENH